MYFYLVSPATIFPDIATTQGHSTIRASPVFVSASPLTARGGDIDKKVDVYVDELERKLVELERKLGEVCLTKSSTTGLIITWDQMVDLVQGNVFQTKA